jgi:hypothetical protein
MYITTWLDFKCIFFIDFLFIRDKIIKIKLIRKKFIVISFYFIYKFIIGNKVNKTKSNIKQIAFKTIIKI